MGGGGSTEYHHHHTEYLTPPEVQKELDDTKQRLQKIEEEAMKQGDPKLYKENCEQLFTTFLEKLPSLPFQSLIEKNTGEIHVGFLGPISSGKTTLINTLFGLNLPVSLGHCTQSCDMVYKKDLDCYWDVPGQNDDYKFYKPENLGFIKSLDKCLILYDNDITMISNVIKVAYALIPDNIILVRTKVDQHTSTNMRSISEEKTRDIEEVRKLLGVELPVYCISSHNVSVGKERYDWEVLKILIEA